MGNSPKISLVATAYNFEKYLEGAVTSLLDQRGGHDFEVIVVDDCSTDGSKEILTKIKDPRFHFFCSEVNRGAVWSANTAVAMARGEYIARFDCDDEWYPWFLDETVSVLEQNPEIGLVYGNINTIDEHGAVNENAGIDRPSSLPVQGNEFIPLLKTHYICAPAILARRQLWESVLPYPETLKAGLADWFITLKMSLLSDFYFVSKPLAKYRVHSEGMHSVSIRNGIAERNMRTILDNFLQNGSSTLPRPEVKKIYAAHYRNFASGYFGEGMIADARRCYLEALQGNLHFLRDKKFMFPFLGSLLGKPAYERLKGLVK